MWGPIGCLYLALNVAGANVLPHVNRGHFKTHLITRSSFVFGKRKMFTLENYE